MNKKDLEIKRNQTQRLYRTPGTANIKRPRNAVFFNPTNSIKHEMGKAGLCYALLEQNKQFITEATEIKTSKRRDIVCLDDGKVYEIETDSKRAERHKEDNVEVILI